MSEEPNKQAGKPRGHPFSRRSPVTVNPRAFITLIYPPEQLGLATGLGLLGTPCFTVTIPEARWYRASVIALLPVRLSQLHLLLCECVAQPLRRRHVTKIQPTGTSQPVA